jgi:SAM-dependent methyltransferase
VVPEAYSPPLEELLEESAERSANEVLPVVFDLVSPRSVVDVGCWFGTWLKVARELGVEDVLGIDAPYTDRSRLRIPQEMFVARDLTAPLTLERRFDLVMSLEVAEHLPPAAADDFVASLTRLAPVVLFSAAIPGQRGEGHLNEQWPAYWAERFAANGFAVADVLRGRFWENPAVTHWYAQNLLLFATPEWLGAHRAVSELSPDLGAMPLIHPRTFDHVVSSAEEKAIDTPAAATSLRTLLRELPPATARAVRSRLRRR